MCQKKQLIVLHVDWLIAVVIFVLDLPKNDAGLASGAMGDLKRHGDSGDGGVPMFAPGEISWIVAAEPCFSLKIGRAFGDEPLRVSTTIPFGADVGSGAQDHLETELIGCHRQPIV